jgi:hypothetical protein
MCRVPKKKRPAGAEVEQSNDGVWVQSDVTPSGTYILAVHFDHDHTRPLDHDAAYAYATTVLAACARAEYDAAVIAQMTRKVGTGLRAATELVGEMRADRPPLDDAATAPLRLEPGVSGSSRRPFLALHLAGKQIGRWDVADGRQHALHVLEGIEGVDLDAAYRRCLMAQVGLREKDALAVVGDLANYR